MMHSVSITLHFGSKTSAKTSDVFEANESLFYPVFDQFD